MMNLEPLKASFLQGKTLSSSCRVTGGFQTTSYPAPPLLSPKPFHQQFPPSILAKAKAKVQSCQQPVQAAYSSNKSHLSNDHAQGHSLSRVKVVLWVTELRRYLFLWESNRLSSTHAAELHQLLCTIEDKMAHPFLTPQVLRETNLGKVMKSFRHGGLDQRSKKVARHVVKYWRMVCLEA